MDHQHILEGDLENPNIPGPEDKFTLFPELPVELRLKIWSLALPVSRVITIVSDYSSAPEFFDPDHPDRTRYKARACAKPVPALLHCNSESRAVALKTYRLSFRSNLQKKPIYYDFRRDSLCMINVHVLQSFMRFWGKDSDTSYWTVGGQKKSKSKIGTIIVRGGPSVTIPLLLFRRYRVATFIIENQRTRNVRILEQARRNFDQSWTECFGKDSKRRPKILFRTPEEIDTLVEVCNSTNLSK
jgi:hypothetical protein